MNEQEQQLQHIELSLNEAKARIDDAAALTRLYKNSDFKRLFLDGYFMKEASRTVLLKADPNMQGEEQQKDCENIIMSIGMLRQHFAKVYTFGTMAEKAMEDDKQAREEILQESLGDEGIE